MQPNAYFFTTQAGYDDELVRIVRNLVAVQAKRIALVYQDNEFGKLLMPLAEKIIAAEGAARWRACVRCSPRALIAWRPRRRWRP